MIEIVVAGGIVYYIMVALHIARWWRDGRRERNRSRTSKPAHIDREVSV